MKKFLPIIIFIILFVGAWQTCQAVDLLIKDYPSIPGAQSPNEASDLPNLINYIYKFALLTCGIVAFISILIGAIQYVTSAGNASKAGDAKDRITQALLGVLILLTAVVILNTINPDLVDIGFKLPEIVTPNPPDPTIDYYCYGCCNPIFGENPCTKDSWKEYEKTACSKLEEFHEYATAYEACKSYAKNYCTILHLSIHSVIETQPCPEGMKKLPLK